MKPTIGTTDSGALEIDVARLIDTRVLVQSNSGGGKSWVIRRLLEQTAKHVQHIMLDTEGEFATLREKFDYVICAPHGADAVATPATAALLAHRLRENRVSAIIDLYDLKMPERRRFVRLFLEELIDAPKSMWHPAIVGVDEAHLYCPEKGEAESAAAVIDLSSRGRKRGLCALLATQRLSKLHKDAAAELLNKMIGRTGLDVDVKRAADELGMNARDAIQTLRSLDPGQFYCFGPALSKSVTKVTVGPVQTTHPKSGDRGITAPPAPSDKIKAMLAKLADLPKEAEQELRTTVDLKNEISRLRRELTVAKREQPKTPAAEIKRIEVPVVGKKAYAGIKDAAAEMQKAMRKIREIHQAWQHNLDITDKRITELCTTLEKVAAPSLKAVVLDPAVIVHKPQQRVAGTEVFKATTTAALALGPNGSLPGPQQRIVDAIAWFESIGISEPDQTAVAFLAGYTIGGGAWNNPRGALRTAGLIDYRGERLALTDSGRLLARAPTSPLTTEELHRRVLERLPGPERKLLQTAINVYPDDLADQDLAERTGYAVGGGAFNNPKGRLRSLGLVIYPASKRVRAADILFIQ